MWTVDLIDVDVRIWPASLSEILRELQLEPVTRPMFTLLDLGIFCGYKWPNLFIIVPKFVVRYKLRYSILVCKEVHCYKQLEHCIHDRVSAATTRWSIDMNVLTSYAMESTTDLKHLDMMKLFRFSAEIRFAVWPTVRFAVDFPQIKFSLTLM